MKPQVFTTAIPECRCSGLLYALNPSCSNWKIRCSESTRFLEHPIVNISIVRFMKTFYY